MWTLVVVLMLAAAVGLFVLSLVFVGGTLAVVGELQKRVETADERRHAALELLALETAARKRAEESATNCRQAYEDLLRYTTTIDNDDARPTRVM